MSGPKKKRKPEPPEAVTARVKKLRSNNADIGRERWELSVEREERAPILAFLKYIRAVRARSERQE